MDIRSSFRSPKTSTMAGSKFPVWKMKPPGPEQQELERLFANKEIDASMSADSVRKSKQIFHDFSATVFANHFRQTKAKYGFGMKRPYCYFTVNTNLFVNFSRINTARKWKNQ